MKKSLFVAPVLALLVLGACEKPAPAPAGAITLKDGMEVPFYGATVKYTLTSNCDWKVIASTVDVVPVSGIAGYEDLTVTVPNNVTDKEIEESFTVLFTNADGVTDETTVTIKVPAPCVTYGGVTYGVRYMADGNYWMSENLRYLPEGVSASDNPAEGSVWYPYSLSVPEGGKAAVATALTDAASVSRFGYFYSPAMALGVEEITADNYQTLEGTRGICPEGWHIPSRSELFGLCGASTKFDGEDAAPADKKDAAFYDTVLGYGSVAKAEEEGFNFTLAGTVAGGKYSPVMTSAATCGVEKYLGQNAMTYILGSTGYTGKNPQMCGMMSTFTKMYMNGRLSVAYLNASKTGVSVRCVLDK